MSAVFGIAAAAGYSLPADRREGVGTAHRIVFEDAVVRQRVLCNVPPRRRPAISLNDVCGPRRASRIKRRAVTLPAEPRVNRAVDRDAVPGQLAVRLDEVPNAGARLGRGGRRGRRSLARGVVGGPRLHPTRGASRCENRCNKNAELRHGSPPALDMDHRDLEKVSYKAQSMLCAALAENFHPSGRRATVIFRGMADAPTSWANQSIRASIVGLSTKSEDIARPTVALSLFPSGIQSTRRRSSLLQESHERWSTSMERYDEDTYRCSRIGHADC